MSIRYPAGFIRIGYDPLKVPDAPTIGTATAGDTQASVAFTAPSNVGGSAISSYTAVSTPSGISASGASSPITVTGLTNGTAYTFAVWALNTYGPSAYSAASGSVTPAILQRAVFAGGQDTTQVNVMDYVTITSTGNATDFGDLTQRISYLAGCASTTRGVYAGGLGAVDSYANVIQYITIATTGNATDFGDLTYKVRFNAGCNSATRGIFASGTDNGGDYVNIINYVTIASVGDATDFGDLTVGSTQGSECSSPTRGIHIVGIAKVPGEGTFVSSYIQYITIASTGDATTFGNLSADRNAISSCSSSTRGLIFGGTNSLGTPVNIIEYITIASTGNATDFGDLITAVYYTASASGLLRGLNAGGQGGGNVINYVTIASTGNSSDFGDLTVARIGLAACSSANGGTQ